MTQLKYEIKQFKEIQMRCQKKLAAAREFFPNNPDVKLLEDEFESLLKLTVAREPAEER